MRFQIQKWKKKAELELFKFFNSDRGKIPNEYAICLICSNLQMSYTELQDQPQDWVMKMMTYLSTKNQVEEHKSKIQQSKIKKR